MPARMIEVISPAGFEEFFREVVELGEVGPPDDSTFAELGHRYGLPFAEPDWLPDIIARCNLAGAQT